jgi:hypothetical protein
MIYSAKPQETAGDVTDPVTSFGIIVITTGCRPIKDIVNILNKKFVHDVSFHINDLRGSAALNTRHPSIRKS